MRRRSGWACAGLLAGALVAAPAPSPAQATVSGTVTEEGSGAPIDAAELVLVDSLGRPAATTLTDGSGRFTMGHPGPGTYVLAVDRIGYVPFSVEVTLDPGGSATLDITAHVLAVEIDGVLVEATQRLDPPTLGLAGLAARIESGVGEFIQRDEIERRNPSLPSDLFVGKPFTTVSNIGWIKRDVRFLGSKRLSGRDCPPTIWVDGLLARDGGQTGRRGDLADTLDDLVPPTKAIQAIEIYRGPAGLPPQFNLNAQCGVIVVWTRR